MAMRERSDTLEKVRRGYRALGLGAHRDVVAMFEDDGDDACGAVACAGPRAGGDGGWVVFDLIDGRPWATRDLVALDLFGGLPSHWELVGVDVERWEHGPWRRFAGLGPAIDGVACLVVGGHYRARPRAPDCRWHVERVPFLHIWRLAGARVESVYSFLDGVEIRRLPAAA
jgi:hypothetical protein